VAFDSINWETLWLLFLSLGLLLKLDDLFKALYTNTLNCVHADVCDSDWLFIGSGAYQGCVVAPDLFLTPVDWQRKRTDHHTFLGSLIWISPTMLPS